MLKRCSNCKHCVKRLGGFMTENKCTSFNGKHLFIIHPFWSGWWCKGWLKGNYHGHRGCDYECGPWSGLSYALHHEGWGDCILCSDGIEQVMGGVLFDTAEEAIEAWNRRAEDGK